MLDAGATDQGRPYFVMEYVQGEPITEYCDRERLTIRERLELFIQVCQAVQHAHQKGIIHRDLKPSNILVTLQDGRPVPQGHRLRHRQGDDSSNSPSRTLFTAIEQIIGTPAYMSPEQAELSGLDIDTRTDIYSLGVLLYELLTGDYAVRCAVDAREAGSTRCAARIRERSRLGPSPTIWHDAATR